MGVKIGTPALYKRVQKLKADLFGYAHNSSPGQVEIPDACYQTIVATILELEEEAFGPQKKV